MCGCLSRAPFLRGGTWPATQACALDWESNRQHFGLQARTQSTELCQPGLSCSPLKVITVAFKSEFHEKLVQSSETSALPK